VWRDSDGVADSGRARRVRSKGRLRASSGASPRLFLRADGGSGVNLIGLPCLVT
jgi:hypothetical protein